MRPTQRLAIIGYGAVAQAVLRHLAPYQAAGGVDGRQVELCGVLLRPGWAEKPRATPFHPVPFFDNLDAVLALKPALVIECAGQGAVAQYAQAVLESGADLLTISMGAFADVSLFTRVQSAARQTGAQIIIPAGAVGGLDYLASVRHDGIGSVLFRSTKPPMAWKGTAAEKQIDLANVTQATCFFKGNARDAARNYPQNANVAAAVALAGVGFEQTTIELVADPAAAGNLNEIVASGAFGNININILGKTRPDAPRTSISAPLSIVRAVLGRGTGFVV